MRTRLRCTDGGWMPPYPTGLGLLYYCIVIICLFKNIFPFHLIPLSISISASFCGTGDRGNLGAGAAKSAPRTPSCNNSFYTCLFHATGMCLLERADTSPLGHGDLAPGPGIRRSVSHHPNGNGINVQQTQEELDQGACPGAATWQTE